MIPLDAPAPVRFVPDAVAPTRRRLLPPLRAARWLAIVLLAVPLAARADTFTPIPRLSVWKFLATPVAAPSNWNTLPYSDAAWDSGPGVLGYGEPYIATPVPYGPDPMMPYRTTYFRRTFTVNENPAFVTSLTLEANYDDGFVAYLNGVEVARRSIAAGPVGYDSAAVSHEGGAYEVINLTSAAGQIVAGTNLLAIEVHQAADTTLDLVMDMELRYVIGTPQITRGPYLQMGAPDRVVVRWRTNLPTDSHVQIGSAADQLTTTVQDGAATTEHEVAVTGLAADTPYFYTVGASVPVLAGADSVWSFHTSPTPGTPRATRVWVLGDSGIPGGALSVRSGYTSYTNDQAPDLWLMLGDNAYNAGTDAEYQAAVFDVFRGMLRRSVLWPTRGNHEALYAGPANDYYDIFSLPGAAQSGGLPSGTEAYYSFDYGDIHFICLDSEGSNRSLGGAMMRWLRDDLAASDRTWNVAFWHHPPYTKGSHDSDNDFDSGGRMRDMRMNALPILDSAGVDLVLTGHSHSYERSCLLRGHYGPSGTLTAEMKVDSGNGRIAGTGPYVKAAGANGTQDGVVYAVAGSSSQISGGLLNHPAMVISLNVLGSMVLDFSPIRLEARFIGTTGAVLDSFTMFKVDPLRAAPPAPARGLGLAFAGGNPAAIETRLSLAIPAAGPARLMIVDATGRRVATLLDQALEPGTRTVAWRGQDGRGRRVASGVYFAVLESGGERRVVRIVRSH